MTLGPEWRALQREAQLAAQQVASGVTALGKAILALHPKPEAWHGFQIGRASRKEPVDHANAASIETKMPGSN
jgi:hypothetical protein